MKTQISSALSDFLDGLCESGTGGTYEVIDLYTVSLINGITLYWASWPLPITFPTTGIYHPVTSVGGNTRVSGQTFIGSSPYVDRSKLVQGLKLEVSQITLTIYANPTMTVGSTPILQAIASGMFSGATVYVDRLWAQTANPLDLSLGTINQFVGQVAEIEELGRSHAVLSVKDPTALLSTPWPRNQYLSGCNHTFGDAGCGFNKASVAQPGIVQAGSNTVTINTNLTQIGGVTAPTSAPTLDQTSDQTDVNLAAQTYFVIVTFTGVGGESGPSPESSIAITGSSQSGANGTTDKLLIVEPPSSPPAGATGWNVYVATASGDEQLQASIVGFSTNWQQTGGLFQGSPPPLIGTAGFFANGYITFTSGVNNKLSSMVSAYTLVDGLGVITVTPPLPSAPSAGDLFSVVPDCSKTMAQCTQYGNLIHYTGFPFVPLPEQAA